MIRQRRLSLKEGKVNSLKQIQADRRSGWPERTHRATLELGACPGLPTQPFPERALASVCFLLCRSRSSVMGQKSTIKLSLLRNQGCMTEVGGHFSAFHLCLGLGGVGVRGRDDTCHHSLFHAFLLLALTSSQN